MREFSPTSDCTRPESGHLAAGASQTSTHYAEPAEHATLAAAWAALRAALTQATKERPIDKLFQLLMAPPYGVKAGVVPVIIAAALIMAHDEVAVFEEGTYQPSLTPDLMERLIKTPDRYSVKYVPANDGQRRLVLEEVATELGITAYPSPSVTEPEPGAPGHHPRAPQSGSRPQRVCCPHAAASASRAIAVRGALYRSTRP